VFFARHSKQILMNLVTARTMHKLSTAVPQSSSVRCAPTPLCFLGLLGVLHEYACGVRPASGCPSHALLSWRLRHFVTKTYA